MAGDAKFGLFAIDAVRRRFGAGAYDFHPFCQTPRHAGRFIPARWVAALASVPDDLAHVATDGYWSACDECAHAMAAELDATVAELEITPPGG